jgi:hypothetical protein
MLLDVGSRFSTASIEWQLGYNLRGSKFLHQTGIPGHISYSWLIFEGELTLSLQ